jgi:hypothetical protein
MPDKDAKKTTDQELKDVSAGAAFEPQSGAEGPAGGGGGGQQGPSWQTNQEVDAQNIDAGAARPKDISPSGPSDSGSQDPGQSYQPQQIDPQNVDAGAVQPKDIGPSGPGGGGSSDGPSFQPQEIDPQNVDAGAVQPKDVSSGPGGGGGYESLSSPLYTPTPTDGPNISQINEGDASDIAAGAAAPGPDADVSGPGGPQSSPSIKVKVQEPDLTGSGGESEQADT